MRAALDDERAVVEETLAVEQPRADRTPHQNVSVTLLQIARPVGIAAEPARATPRRAHRSDGSSRSAPAAAARRRRRPSRASPSVAAASTTITSRPQRRAGDAASSFIPSRASSCGMKAMTGKPGRTISAGPVQHLGRRKRLGVNRAGLLQLQRRLGGDGEGRAAPEHEGRVSRAARPLRPSRGRAARLARRGSPGSRASAAASASSSRQAATSAAPATSAGDHRLRRGDRSLRARPAAAAAPRPRCASGESSR